MTVQILWTALPNGFDALYYYFSVFVSHRLSGGTTNTLADYPLGQTATDPSNWAASMLAMQGASALAGLPLMSVSFNGGGNYVPAMPVPAVDPVTQLPVPKYYGAPLAPAIWTDVFPSTLPVEDYAMSVLPQTPSNRRIRSFNATALVAQYEKLYADAALNSAGDYPSVSTGPAADFVAAIGGFPGLLGVLRDKYRSGTPARHEPPSAANAPPYADLLNTVLGHYGTATANVQQIALEHYLAYRFYRRNTGSQYGPRNAAAVMPPPVPQLTFHKLVGMLADHPTLLRNLGLVLDYRIFKDQVVGQLASPPVGRLTVQANVPNIPAGTFDNRFPLTGYRITADGFYALETAATNLVNGMAQLASGQGYSVAQLDADGHTQKMISYGLAAAGWTYNSKAYPMMGDFQRDAQHTSPTQSLPARRTGGLTVLQSNRADALVTQFAQSDTNNSNVASSKPVTLLSPDVTRGFRVDIWDSNSGATAAGGPWRSLCQRGGADVVSGTSFPLAPADIEGFVKAASGSRGDPSSTADEQNTLYVHEAVFGWDGWSLCARRPGRTIGHADGDGNQHPVVGFLPNHAPTGYPIVSNYAITPGTLPRLRFGRSYSFRARSVDLAGNSLAPSYQSTTIDPTTATTAATYLRYEPVAAPTLVLWRALTDGESVETLVIRSNPTPVTDLAQITFGANATAYAATSVGTAAKYLDHSDRHVAPPKTSQIMAETHGMLDKLTAQAAFYVSSKESGTLFDASIWNVDTGTLDALPTGELAFVPAPGPTTPGDPPASGQYVLHQLPKLTLPYLPDPLADGLSMQPAPGSATPPIVLPYVVDAKGWPRLQPIHLLLQESPTSTTALTTAPGTFTASLPPATLAVVRYSTSPSAAQLPTTVVGTQVAGTPAALGIALAGGNWLLSPYREMTLVHAVQRPLLIPSFTSPGIYRNLGWTYVAFTGQTMVNLDGHSTVHIDINASWTDPIDDPANPLGPQTSSHRGRAFTLNVAYADTSIFVQPALTGIAQVVPLRRHELGDTKHRWVTYSPDGTTRYREYFPPALTADPTQITTPGQTQILNVLASRRPDPMVVLYAIPSFKWTTNADGSVTRAGRTVRVYFDRPWYSSGDDELVGVLLTPNANIIGPIPIAQTQYTSEWGRDPVWSSSGPIDALAPQHFVNAVTVTPQPAGVMTPAPALPTGPFDLAEDPNNQATVVAFKPEYNSARNLWFVDIEMDPGDSYFPFVRLSLARFQPHAITSPSQHLSRAVRTEFLQLAPDRTAAIAAGASRTVSVTVSGVAAHNWFAEITGESPANASLPLPSSSFMPGVVPSATPAPTVGGGHRVTAQVQNRPSGSMNDLLWTDAGDEVALASYAEMGGVFWAASLPLPPADSTQEFRLLIRERERYVSDTDVATGVDGLFEYGERLVYASVFPLTVGP